VNQETVIARPGKAVAIQRVSKDSWIASLRSQ